MEAVPVLRTMTFTQLATELRERGMAIGQEKLKAAIAAGVLSTLLKYTLHSGRPKRRHSGHG